MIKHGDLRARKFRAETYGQEITRYCWGEASLLQLATFLKPRAYLCHATAVTLHGLAKLSPKTIYLNVEQSAKPSDGSLTQDGINRALGRVEVSLVSPLTRESIDERLAKIELARENLTAALVAMDELKITAENNRTDLDRLTAAITKAENEKADLNVQLEAVRQLAAIDSDIVRETLRIPTEVDKWRERIWGFIFGGVVAGLIATAVWELGIKPRLPEHPPAIHQTTPPVSKHTHEPLIAQQAVDI